MAEFLPGMHKALGSDPITVAGELVGVEGCIDQQLSCMEFTIAINQVI